MVMANRTKDDRIKELEAYARRLRSELKKQESQPQVTPPAYLAPPDVRGIERRLSNISWNLFVIGLIMLFWSFGGFLNFLVSLGGIR